MGAGSVWVSAGGVTAMVLGSGSTVVEEQPTRVKTPQIMTERKAIFCQLAISYCQINPIGDSIFAIRGEQENFVRSRWLHVHGLTAAPGSGAVGTFEAIFLSQVSLCIKFISVPHE